MKMLLYLFSLYRWIWDTDEYMSVMDVQNFEKGRIKALQDERVYIQKKTFTKWANAFLEKVGVLALGVGFGTCNTPLSIWNKNKWYCIVGISGQILNWTSFSFFMSLKQSNV